MAIPRPFCAFAVGLVLVGVAASSPAPTTAGPQQVNPGPDPAGVAAACGALWRHPVSAPIVDGFRPPDNRYGPGNRGLEYGTAPGDPVAAVGDGTVRFAGSVGGNRFVVVQHGPDLKATYAYLNEIVVSVGRVVRAGDPVATAAAGFHLTARRTRSPAGSGRSETYIDPLPLLTGRCFTVKLVPLPTGE